MVTAVAGRERTGKRRDVQTVDRKPTSECLLPMSAVGARVSVIASSGGCVAAAPRAEAAARRRPASPPRRSWRSSTTPSSMRASRRCRGLLEDACPPAPREACLLLDAVALWWRIQLDPHDTSRDRLFQHACRSGDCGGRGVDRARAGRGRRPGSTSAAPTAPACSGGSCRHEPLAAARDGKRIKDALEQALMLDPECRTPTSASGCITTTRTSRRRRPRCCDGCWRCLAAIGSRGSKRCSARASTAQLLRSEADYQLHVLDLLVREAAGAGARSCSGACASAIRGTRSSFRWPRRSRTGTCTTRPRASAPTGRCSPRHARASVAEPGLAATIARLGMARQLDHLFETDKALEHLRAIVDAAPAAPHGALARAHLQLGEALDRLGSRPEAVAAYRAAIAAAPPEDTLDIAERARAGLRHDARSQPPPRAYRLSIEGWRALERGALDEAARAIASRWRCGPMSRSPSTGTRSSCWHRSRTTRR